MAKTKGFKMNEKRTKIMEALMNSEEGLTLSELSVEMGEEIKSGTTNVLLKEGLIEKVGTKKIPVTVYREVSIYKAVEGAEEKIANYEKVEG
jgi:Fe2+ or Zn2+ uptake regulation protein